MQVCFRRLSLKSDYQLTCGSPILTAKRYRINEASTHSKVISSTPFLAAAKNGEWVFESIQTRLDEWCPKLFGYHMLKLGGLSCEFATHNCNIKHQVNVDIENPLHSVIADAYDLPFVEKVSTRRWFATS